MDLQDLQTKISLLEKKIVGINQNKSTSYSNNHLEDKENSLHFNQVTIYIYLLCWIVCLIMKN